MFKTVVPFGWKKGCQTITKGGFGIYSVKRMDKALLENWLRRFSNDNNELWHATLIHRYQIANDGGYSRYLPKCILNVESSWLVTAFCGQFLPHVQYRRVKGNRIHFQTNPWCGSTRLANPFHSLSAISEDVGVNCKGFRLYGKIWWLYSMESYFEEKFAGWGD